MKNNTITPAAIAAAMQAVKNEKYTLLKATASITLETTNGNMVKVDEITISAYQGEGETEQEALAEALRKNTFLRDMDTDQDVSDPETGRYTFSTEAYYNDEDWHGATWVVDATITSREEATL